MSAYTCYLIGMKTLLLHNCVDLNGVCSCRRVDAFAMRVISGPHQKHLKEITLPSSIDTADEQRKFLIHSH